MADGIENVDYASGCVEAVESIDLITSHEVEQAAQDLARAAAEARSREFILDMASGPAPGQEIYLDTATGDYYVPAGVDTGRWMNTTTGQEVDGNPTEVRTSDYDWLVSWFTQFHERWPSYPRTMAEHCRTAKAALQSGRMTPIVNVKDMVNARWDGAASDDFRDFFLTPFVKAVNNQQALLDELAVAMYAYEGVLRQARLDARAVATNAINVLDSIDGYGGGGDAGLVLGVIGVAVSVVAAVATGGTTLGITLGLIGAGVSGAQVVNDALSQEEPVTADQQITGDTVDQVVDNVVSVLSDLRRGMDAEEQGIANLLGQTRSEVSRLLASDSPLDVATILPNEPDADRITDITDGQLPSPAEFHPY